MNKKAFTLMEILIVIAIIGILAAIAFPVYFKQKEKTQSISCMSNLRQQWMGLRSYIEDNDGYWPIYNGLVDNVKKKTATLACPSYVKTNKALGLPEIGYGFNMGFIGLPPVNPARLDSTIKFPTTTVAVAETTQGHDTGRDKCIPGDLGANGMVCRGDRHNGGGNFVFCDGHAQWYMPSAVTGLDDVRLIDGTFPSFANQTAVQEVQEGKQ
jgi:prepilin-type N-terminal cleavage/methylation domain-containing protein/prepilin-type processing-associated H-X9-DG protein